MRKINKGQEAAELTQWKKSNPHGIYHDLEQTEAGKATRVAIRRDCILEQKGLCAFCCKPVAVESAHNAHLKCQKSYPTLTLDWNNIVASCKSLGHCGYCQDTKTLPLTPLMNECEKDLKFYISGKVEGLTNDAKTTITTLNLDAQALRNRRNATIKQFAFSSGFSPIDDIDTWDNELLHAFIAECAKEDDEGNVVAFAPVLINIAQQFLR